MSIFILRCSVRNNLSLFTHLRSYNAGVGCVSNSRKRPFSSGFLPIERIKTLKSDTIIYTLEKTKTVRFATIYGILQCGLCIFLGFNVFYSLKDTSLAPKNHDSKKNINLGDFKYRLIAGLCCILLGLISGGIAYTLPSRIVKQLTLCKGGSSVTFLTYGPFGKTIQLNYPLERISCAVSRDQAKSYIPVKIRNKWFYFLIDIKGKFHQPALFDVTVGTKSWK